jgi:WD40 repeat protein
MTDRAAEVAQRSADRLVRHVAAADPDTVALAEVLALAVRVDPALLRAARRRFLPHRGPDLEADLWHSPLVSGANRSGLVFDQTVADRLLLRLARHQERCQEARQVVEQEHRAAGDSPPGWLADTLRLEEELRYLTLVPDGHRRARRLLREVAEQVEASGAAGLQAWLDGLNSRLPLSLRGASVSGPGDRPGGPAGPGGATPGGHTIGLRLLEAALEIRATPYGPMHRLRLPAGPPPAVFVDGRLVALESLPHLEPLVDPGAVTVQALDGSSLTLRRRRRRLTPRLPRSLQAHTADAWGCAFSPDGTLLATTSDDRTVRLWDTTTGTAVHVLTGHTAPVHACAFSPDGTRLASAGDDHAVRIWDTAAGIAVQTLEIGRRGEVRACAFSPDGSLLATAGPDRTVRLWDTLAWSEQRALTGHAGAVLACTFSPDGSLLATTSNDRTVRLWRPATGTLVHRLTGYAASVEGAAFSPDGSLLATTSADRTVRTWDPFTGDELRTLPGHTSTVWACAFSADGSLLASTSNDGTVRLWDPTTGAQLQAFPGHNARLRSCAFSPDGTVLAATGDDGTVRLWDPTGAPPAQRLAGHTSWVNGCAYAPDGSFLATAGADHTVRLWDPPSGAVVQVLEGHTHSIEACAVSPDARRIATASAAAVEGDGAHRVTGDVGIWEATTGRRLRTLRGHADRVHAAAFSPDGSLLATAAADGTVVLWDAARGEPVDRLAGHRGPVQACAFSPDGSLLATAGDDQTVRLWDPATGEPGLVLTGHIREVLSCAFDPGGRWLASTGIDQTIRLWDPATGEPVATLRGHDSRVHACTFSPDGSLLASASADATLRLWDPERAEEVDELAGPASMLDCAFSPDGTALAGTSADDGVTVWDLLGRDVAVKGDTVALWLGGRPGDAAAIAGAVAARPLTAGCTPVVASGGGAVPGVLLAAGLAPRRVEQAVVASDLTAGRSTAGRSVPLLARWLDPVARLERRLAGLGAARCRDLRVPVGDRRDPGADRPVPAEERLQRYRYHGVVVDAATDEVVVLPHDAKRLGIDPDEIPLAELALVAAGGREATFGRRRFGSAVGRAFDPGPRFADLPLRRPVFAVDAEDGDGAVPARRFPPKLKVTTVTVPWLYRAEGARLSRRRRDVLARIGAQSLRTAVTDEPAPARRRRPDRSIRSGRSARPA